MLEPSPFTILTPASSPRSTCIASDGSTRAKASSPASLPRGLAYHSFKLPLFINSKITALNSLPLKSTLEQVVRILTRFQCQMFLNASHSAVKLLDAPWVWSTFTATTFLLLHQVFLCILSQNFPSQLYFPCRIHLWLSLVQQKRLSHIALLWVLSHEVFFLNYLPTLWTKKTEEHEQE